MIVFYELFKYTICFICIVYAWFAGWNDPMSICQPILHWFETTWMDQLAVGYYNWYMTVADAPDDIIMTPGYIFKLLFVIFALILDLFVCVCIEWFGLDLLFFKWRTKKFKKVNIRNSVNIDNIYTNVKNAAYEIDRRNK